MAHMVFCVRYKKEMEGLEEPPFDSEFGQKIFKNVSQPVAQNPLGFAQVAEGMNPIGFFLPQTKSRKSNNSAESPASFRSVPVFRAA